MRRADEGPADPRSLFEALVELGGRHMFRFRDGRRFEGWVVEVGEDAMLVSSVDQSDEDDPIPVTFDEVDLDSIACVDDRGAVVRLPGRRAAPN